MVSIVKEKFNLNITNDVLFKFNITEILLFLTKITLTESYYNKLLYFKYEEVILSLLIYKNSIGKLIINIDIV